MIRSKVTLVSATVLAALAAFSVAAGNVAIDGPVSASGRLYVVVSPEAAPGPTAVTVFGLDADGRPRQGETIETGGLGAAFSSPQGIATNPRGDLLFVANNHSDDVSVFHILTDGSLDPVPGPFPVGGTPAYLAVDPSGEFLYVGDIANGRVRVLRIDDTGELSAVQAVPAGLPAEIEVHPSGDLLFVASFTGIRVFAVAENGTLTEVAGSPFAVPGNRTLHLELDSYGDRLFGLDLDRGIAAYDVEPSGALELVDGSPAFVSSFASTLELGEREDFLFASSPFDATVDVFRVLGRGQLHEISGSPFSGDFVPAELLNPRGTSRLYEIGAGTRRISVFEIGSNGRLTEAPNSPVDVADVAARVPNGAVFASRPVGFLTPP